MANGLTGNMRYRAGFGKTMVLQVEYETRPEYYDISGTQGPLQKVWRDARFEDFNYKALTESINKEE